MNSLWVQDVCYLQEREEMPLNVKEFMNLNLSNIDKEAGSNYDVKSMFLTYSHFSVEQWYANVHHHL